MCSPCPAIACSSGLVFRFSFPHSPAPSLTLVAHIAGLVTTAIHSTQPLSPKDLREGFSCISRLFWGPKCVGTAFRVGHHEDKKHGLILAARHCCLEGSSLLEVLGAFEGELTLLASFPAYDFIVFKGKPGPCLNLATAEGRYGFPGWWPRSEGLVAQVVC